MAEMIEDSDGHVSALDHPWLRLGYATLSNSIGVSLVAPFDATTCLLQIQRVPRMSDADRRVLASGGGGGGSSEFASTAWSESTLPPVLLGQVHAMRAMRSFPLENSWALWRGNRVSCLRSFLFYLAQTMSDVTISSALSIPKEFTPDPATVEQMSEEELIEAIETTAMEAMPGMLFSSVASSIVAGLVTSPLQVIQVRHIARHPSVKLGSSWQVAKEIYSKSGILGFFPDLTANILQHGILELLDQMEEVVIGSLLGLHAESSPVLFAAADALYTMFGLSIKLSLLTVSRRLQIQSAFSDHPGYTTCVRTNSPQLPYKGTFDCLSRIVAEEEGGVFALYRGWAPQVIGSLLFSVAFLLTSD